MYLSPSLPWWKISVNVIYREKIEKGEMRKNESERG
jgi:hypothetical protein